MKKCLAVGIILLFIGVAIAPSINSSVVKTSEDFIEVTSQACGTQGFGNTTVKLTKQQYQNLKHYLVDFRAKLNQTTSREDAIPIFKNAIVELNTYGLLPKGMSVEQAQKLVIGDNLNSRVRKSLEILKHKTYHSSDDSIINRYCLVEANCSEGIDLNILSIISVLMGITCVGIQYAFPIIAAFLLFFPVCLLYYSFIKPFCLTSIVDISHCQISTFGLYGKVSENEFNGFLWFFTGLKITTNLMTLSGVYLGFALSVME